MSTDHQRYSTENQSAVIQAYAARRGMQVVRSYADQGKSGLKLEGRDALAELIETVTSGQPDFEAILVYDVSRWGRFQDTDESAHYEYLCRRAGIAVHYCAEQFENDGSSIATLVKNMKRSMAAIYSQDLSRKVFEGQARLIEKGFRQGGPAGFGLRRLLIDQNGDPKTTLRKGEHKSLQTDRVILVPGPDEEIDIVREVYRKFVKEGLSEKEIAEDLNAREVMTDNDRPWTRGTVHQLLINEKYIGNNVWNRSSCKLKSRRVRNAPRMWHRANGCFQAIVDKELFEAANAIIAARSEKLTDEQMLEALRALLEYQGALSGIIIDEAENLPSSGAYRSRFGSLLRAYSLVGFRPRRDYTYIEINRRLRRMFPDVVDEVLAGIAEAGGTAIRDEATDLITLNDECTLSLVIVRCCKTPAGSLRWKIRLDTGLLPDLSVVIRMDALNKKPLDYFIFPVIDTIGAGVQLVENNGLALDGYRFDSLDPLFALSARSSLKEVA